VLSDSEVEPPWKNRLLRTCDACAVPVIASHSVDGDKCTACWLQDLSPSLKGDCLAALSLLREHAVCAYCGEHSSSIDVIAADYPPEQEWAAPICDECSSLTHGREFKHFEQKRLHVKHLLSQRYEHLLEAREWDREELAELGRGLRASTAILEQGRRIVLARIGFLFDQLIT